MTFLPSNTYRKTRGIIRRGTRADQPLATTVLLGTLYFVTDEFLTERSNGTVWESYSDVGAGGANTSLSNLTSPTAINRSLLPDGAFDIGSSILNWAVGWFGSLISTIIYGSTVANGNLTLEGTGHATKTTSYVILQPTTGKVGIGITNPDCKFLVRGEGSTTGFNVRILNQADTTNFLQYDNGITIFGGSSPNGGTDPGAGGAHLVSLNQPAAFTQLILSLARNDNAKNVFFSTMPSGANTPTNVNWLYGMFANTNNFSFAQWDGTSVNQRLIIASAGQVGLGQTSPTAILHIKAGTTAANSAPIKLASGSLLTTPEAGAIEFLTDKIYFTITTGAARKTIAFLESPALVTPDIGVASGTSLSLSGALDIISTGAAPKAGQVTLVAGTATVNTTAIGASSLVFFQRVSAGGTIGISTTYTKVNGTSFTINSDNSLDTSTFNWWIVETH